MKNCFAKLPENYKLVYEINAKNKAARAKGGFFAEIIKVSCSACPCGTRKERRRNEI